MSRPYLSLYITVISETFCTMYVCVRIPHKEEDVAEQRQKGCLLAVLRLLQCWYCGASRREGKLLFPWGQQNMGIGERILAWRVRQMKTGRAMSRDAAVEECWLGDF